MQLRYLNVLYAVLWKRSFTGFVPELFNSQVELLRDLPNKPTEYKNSVFTYEAWSFKCIRF